MDEEMTTLNTNVTLELMSLRRPSGVSECTILNTILMDQ